MTDDLKPSGSGAPTPDDEALTALSFAEGAIIDAICLEDGLDGGAGEAVLKMIRAALIANGREPITIPPEDESGDPPYQTTEERLAARSGTTTLKKYHVETNDEGHPYLVETGTPLALDAELHPVYVAADVEAALDELAILRACVTPNDGVAGRPTVLNAYGRQCYESGRESALHEVAELRAAVETKQGEIEGLQRLYKGALEAVKLLQDARDEQDERLRARLPSPPEETQTK